MYSTTDNTSDLLAHELSVATQGDDICTLVKRGKFNFSTFTINAYQSIEYLLNKINAADNPSDYEDQNIVLIDKLQDYHDKEVGNFTVTPVTEPEEATSPLYTEPILGKVVTGVDIVLTDDDLVVGNVIPEASLLISYEDSIIPGSSAGTIYEPWNNNTIQNVRVGQYISANTVLTSAATHNYGTNGGTQYTTLASSVGTTTIAESGLSINTTVSDVEIGYGTTEFGLQFVRDVGPTPVDSDGTSLDTLVFDYTQDGFLVGETLVQPGSGSIPENYRITLTGYYPIFVNLGGQTVTLERSIGLSNPSAIIFSVFPISNNYYFRICKEDVDTRGVKILEGYSRTDLTPLAIQSTVSETLSSGITVDYYQYAIPDTTLGTSSQFSIEFQSSGPY